MIVEDKEFGNNMKNKNLNSSHILVPMIVNRDVKGVLSVCSYERFFSGEVKLLQTIANNLAFAINAIELDDVKKKAYEQIEHNIEQFAILVDHIRNPLAAIHAFAELYMENEELSNKFTSQVNKILNVIKKLERGWLESEQVREFLKKY